MKKTRFTEVQIMGVLRQMEGAQLCREHGMSSATLYKWRAKYSGIDASLISEMKAKVPEQLKAAAGVRLPRSACKSGRVGRLSSSCVARSGIAAQRKIKCI